MEGLADAWSELRKHSKKLTGPENALLIAAMQQWVEIPLANEGARLHT